MGLLRVLMDPDVDLRLVPGEQVIEEVRHVWPVFIWPVLVLVASLLLALWSLATAWRESWPADWHHLHPDNVSQEGPWTILTGSLEAEAGTWRFRDAYRPRGRTVECVRRWEWHGDRPAEQTTLAVRWQAPRAKGQCLLPVTRCFHANP